MSTRARRHVCRRLGKILDQQERLRDPKVGVGKGNGAIWLIGQVVGPLPTPIRWSVWMLALQHEKVIICHIHSLQKSNDGQDSSYTASGARRRGPQAATVLPASPPSRL